MINNYSKLKSKNGITMTKKGNEIKMTTICYDTFTGEKCSMTKEISLEFVNQEVSMINNEIESMQSRISLLETKRDNLTTLLNDINNLEESDA